MVGNMTITFRSACLAAVLCAAAPTAFGQVDLDSVNARDPRRTPVVEIFHKWRDSVVYLTGPTATEQGPSLDEFFKTPMKRDTIAIGSGFVIQESGYVITNAHAVERMIAHHATLLDGMRYGAELIGVAHEYDLAVLKVNAGQLLHAVEMGRSDDYLLGETIVIISNPAGLLHTCTSGIISAADRQTQPVNNAGLILRGLLQTDASINPGSSGGPWFDVLGNVVGVTTAMQAKSQNIGFGIPIAMVRHVVPDMLDVERRYLIFTGLETQEQPYEPCIVSAVAAHSPAAAAGFHIGDVIRRVNGHAVLGRCEFLFSLIDHKPGDTLQFLVARGDQSLNLSLALAARPKPDGAAILQQRYGLTAIPLSDAKAAATSLRVNRGVVISAVVPGAHLQQAAGAAPAWGRVGSDQQHPPARLGPRRPAIGSRAAGRAGAFRAAARGAARQGSRGGARRYDADVDEIIPVAVINLDNSSVVPIGARGPMKSYTEYLTLNIPSKMAFQNLTPQVEAAVKKSGVQEGIVLVNAMHITASVFINDNERGLHHDFGAVAGKTSPLQSRPQRLPPQSHGRGQCRRPSQASSHGPRGGGGDHRRQARFRSVGANLLRRIRRLPAETSAGEDPWGVRLPTAPTLDLNHQTQAADDSQQRRGSRLRNHLDIAVVGQLRPRHILRREHSLIAGAGGAGPCSVARAARRAADVPICGMNPVAPASSRDIEGRLSAAKVFSGSVPPGSRPGRNSSKTPALRRCCRCRSNQRGRARRRRAIATYPRR